MTLARRPLVAALLALAALAACNRGGAFTAVDGDSYLGAADSKVVLVEYAAPTCPACKAWHDQFWAKLKTDYIDTGKIKFVLRELPSHNPPVDAAIFSIARCTGQANFFKVMDEAFATQQQIEMASRSGQAREAVVTIAAKFGMSSDQAQACLSDPAHAARIQAVQTMAGAEGVSGTPSFVLNGKLIQDNRLAGITRALDAALAAPAQ
jgi:protein-disulfide isomerase